MPVNLNLDADIAAANVRAAGADRAFQVSQIPTVFASKMNPTQTFALAMIAMTAGLSLLVSSQRRLVNAQVSSVGKSDLFDGADYTDFFDERP